MLNVLLNIFLHAGLSFLFFQKFSIKIKINFCVSIEICSVFIYNTSNVIILTLKKEGGIS